MSFDPLHRNYFNVTSARTVLTSLCIPVVLYVHNSTADQLDQENRPILGQAVVSLDGVKHISNLT